MVEYVRKVSGSHFVDRRTPIPRREIEAVLAAANGLTREESAKALFRSPDTVKTHLSMAYYRLGVASAAQAVAVLLATGVITAEQIRPGEVPLDMIREVNKVSGKGRGR